MDGDGAIRLILPFPPSVNCLYSGNRRRFKSKRYKAWIAEAEGALLQNSVPTSLWGEALEVTYRLRAPDNRCRDLANGEKALSDFLVDHHFIQDDSRIQRLVMEWADDLALGLAEVTIKRAVIIR